MSYMNLTADQPDVELTWFPDRWLQFSTEEPKPWLGRRSGNPALAFENLHGRQLYNLFWTCVHNTFLCMDLFLFFSQLRPSRILPYSSMWLSLSPCCLCNLSVAIFEASHGVHIDHKLPHKWILRISHYLLGGGQIFCWGEFQPDCWWKDPIWLR